MDYRFAFLDLETTGGHPGFDRIIEIGVLLTDGLKETGKFEALINPGRSISPFISQITGISNDDIVGAPRFKEVAREVYELIDGRIVVAHNARFDYSFLRSEFSRIGFHINWPQLCTVKLSRTLYPQCRGHSLDAICDRFGIVIHNRHRALPDALAVHRLINIFTQEHGPDIVKEVIQKLLKRPSLPPLVESKIIDNLPQTVGVYIFYDKDGYPLYIGKSINIKDRVLSHFYDDLNSVKELRLKNELAFIETHVAAGEIEALLLESRLVKELQPVYNRQLRVNRGVWVLKSRLNREGYLELKLDRLTAMTYKDKDEVLAIGRTKRSLTNLIKAAQVKQGLCPKLCGIETGKGACFAYHLEECAGACIGEEAVEKYNLKVKTAFAGLGIETWPFEGPVIIAEKNQTTEKEAYHLVDRWSVLGTFAEADEIGRMNYPSEPEISVDTYRILRQALLSGYKNGFKVIPFNQDLLDQPVP